MTTFQDVTRICTECGHEYTWPERDQRFSHERGYLPPKRCPSCRRLKKQRLREREATNFDQR